MKESSTLTPCFPAASHARGAHERAEKKRKKKKKKRKKIRETPQEHGLFTFASDCLGFAGVALPFAVV
jgi:hypothetical protein